MAFAHLVSLSHCVRGSPGVASLLRIGMRFDSGCRHQQTQPIGERGGGGKNASFGYRENLLATVLKNFRDLGGSMPLWVAYRRLQLIVFGLILRTNVNLSGPANSRTLSREAASTSSTSSWKVFSEGWSQKISICLSKLT